MEIADYIVAEDRRLVELVLEGDDRAFEYLLRQKPVKFPVCTNVARATICW